MLKAGCTDLRPRRGSNNGRPSSDWFTIRSADAEELGALGVTVIDLSEIDDFELR